MYNKNFGKQMEQFDKDFSRIQRLFVAWGIVATLLTIAILAGLGFVAFKLLVSFGVL
jgi:hypothetical protein